ncbi:MAG: translation initiation factor IF-6 [Candidatus Thermoplasmatota archaeon]|nr:translation initiation factor IF-6 [Candidatus Thermoplasmatota archaeon]
MFELLDFNENPNVGVYCRANDAVVFLQKQLLKKVKKKISAALDVKLVELSIADSTIIGSLLALNSNGVIVTSVVGTETLNTIREQDLNFYVVKDVINAAGNDILTNDHGALIHPDIKSYSLKKIEKTLGVPAQRGTIASMKTVGMAAVVTNKGCLCHPKVTDDEKKVLEKIFDVEVMIGTVNHGHPMIGSGLVANTKGAIIGNRTTGIEMGRIEEALGFLD